MECPDREHQCFYMDRNNPVWREYLKAVIRIQIDAGVDGIQLDEAELPMAALQYGGCFCKDCMKGFRATCRSCHDRGSTTSLDGVDLATFHYGEWLLERGYDFKDGPRVDAAVRRLLRLPVPVRSSGTSASWPTTRASTRGRSAARSSSRATSSTSSRCTSRCADDVDLVITEMRNTTYRQPEWYRYVAAFAGDKDVVVVENPYGGVVPELIGLLAEGRGTTSSGSRSSRRPRWART